MRILVTDREAAVLRTTGISNTEEPRSTKTHVLFDAFLGALRCCSILELALPEITHDPLLLRSVLAGGSARDEENRGKFRKLFAFIAAYPFVAITVRPQPTAALRPVIVWIHASALVRRELSAR